MKEALFARRIGANWHRVGPVQPATGDDEDRSTIIIGGTHYEVRSFPMRGIPTEDDGTAKDNLNLLLSGALGR